MSIYGGAPACVFCAGQRAASVTALSGLHSPAACPFPRGPLKHYEERHGYYYLLLRSAGDINRGGLSLAVGSPSLLVFARRLTQFQPRPPDLASRPSIDAALKNASAQSGQPQNIDWGEGVGVGGGVGAYPSIAVWVRCGIRCLIHP